jgi:hypothetical protein
MTESEAITVVGEQFTGLDGFLRKLQSGRGFDYEAIKRVHEALNTLRDMWATALEVPKSGLLPLIDVHSSIQSCAPLYPGQEEEISRLAGDISQQIEDIFPLQLPELSEVEACALVYGHFRGLPSLSLALYMHAPVADEWIEQLLKALEVLAQAWEQREYVPKAIGGSMLEGGGMVRGYEPLYPDFESRWGALADRITSQVKRCLS